MIKMASPHLGKEELKAIKIVFESRWLGLGKVVFKFENQLKKFFNIKNVISCSRRILNKFNHFMSYFYILLHFWSSQI